MSSLPELQMFKRLLILASLGLLPVAASGGSAPSDDAGTLKLTVATGQGTPLLIRIPSQANVQPIVQAPYALIGMSATDAPHHYRQVGVGQGGWLLVQTD
jgi:hypothetical protein